MRRALALLTLAAVAAAGPSDFLRYEGTKNGNRINLRTHGHAFGADGYRPVSPMWADVPFILALSPQAAGKLQFKITLLDGGELKVKGSATTSGDEATVTYAFSSKDETLTVDDGTATVTMKIDAKRRLVKSARATIKCRLVRLGQEEQVDETWTVELHSERIHGAPGFQKAVDDAIDSGVEALKATQQSNGTYPPHKIYPIGTTALVTFTLASCGVPREDPAVENALAFLVSRMPRTTYDRAVALMALDRAYTPPGELARAHKRGLKEFKRELPASRLKWAMKVAAELEKFASAPGSWAYGKRMGERWPDTSNTQYAVLGLRAAARLGYKADPRTWLGVLQHFRKMRGNEQLKGSVSLVREGEAVTSGSTGKTRAAAKVKKKDGRGYRYRGNKTAATGTMTTAGIASLLIAREELLRLRYKVKAKVKTEIDRAVLGAWLWLDRHWAMARVPGHRPAHHYHYYYLYAVERAAVLDRVKRVGGNDWYFEGAAWLLDTQRAEGAWERPDAPDNVATCFALLFLKRATAPLTLTR